MIEVSHKKDVPTTKKVLLRVHLVGTRVGTR